MSRASVIAVLLLASVAVANAAPQCYRYDEIKADQAVRYQAKLMVLSDSCGSDSYTLFVRRNARTLSQYQQQMVEHFRRVDGRRAEAVFDRFITRLANEVSLRIGRQPLASVCSNAAGFLAQALDFGRDGFKRYVAAQATAARESYPVCAAD